MLRSEAVGFDNRKAIQKAIALRQQGRLDTSIVGSGAILRELQTDGPSCLDDVKCRCESWKREWFGEGSVQEQPKGTLMQSGKDSRG